MANPSGQLQLNTGDIGPALQSLNDHVDHANTLATNIKNQADDLVSGPWRSHNATLFGQRVEEKYGDISLVVQKLDSLRDQTNNAQNSVQAQAGHQ